MLALNKVILAGEISEKPELRYTPEGTAVACFSIAVVNVSGAQNGRIHRTIERFGVVAWRQLAELCEQELDEGTAVYVEGHLTNHMWRDPVGRQMARTEVVAEKIQVIQSSYERNRELESRWRY